MYKQFLLALGVLWISSAPAAPTQEPILAPCDRCELIFEAMPTQLERFGVLHSAGTPLEVRGTVRDAAGARVPNVIVYIHHTDAQGIYPGATRAQPHGSLRAWARTDFLGRYGFKTILPAAYPARANQQSEPAHIHMMVLEPGRCAYFIDDILFSDDPQISWPRRESALKSPRGGRGLQIAFEDGQGGWQLERDITLGLNIPNYDRCGR